MYTNPKPIELLESMFQWQIEPWFVLTFDTVYKLDSKTLELMVISMYSET
jgi:hypothetical protein